MVGNLDFTNPGPLECRSGDSEGKGIEYPTYLIEMAGRASPGKRVRLGELGVGGCKSGEVAEWPKAQHWKCCIWETVSWVQIPPSPPFSLEHFAAFSSPRRIPRCFGDIERGFPVLRAANPALWGPFHGFLRGISGRAFRSAVL